MAVSYESAKTDRKEKKRQPGTGAEAAQENTQALEAARPGPYQSTGAGKLEELRKELEEREPFRYDMNADPAYRQYREQAAREGGLAMEDTMGRAAGLTGGYGSSYSQAAGQGSYLRYLKELNDRVPELYEQALERYRAEGEALLERYDLAYRREQAEYDRYRDEMAQWTKEYGMATDRQDRLERLDRDDYWKQLDYDRKQAELELSREKWAESQRLDREKWDSQQAFDREKWEAELALDRDRLQWQKDSSRSDLDRVLDWMEGRGITGANARELLEILRQLGLLGEG